MKALYVVHVKKSIGTKEEAYPIGASEFLGRAQSMMLNYAIAHKHEVSGGDEWVAEETKFEKFNMLIEISNSITIDRIEVRIYVLYLEKVDYESTTITSGGQPL